jgi:predicted DNA-binding protein (MmcQ/YjbR family)
VRGYTVDVNLESLVNYCRKLPFVVEDVKWGNDLVFSIQGGKMFSVFSIEGDIHASVSFKVDDFRFLEMTDRPQFIPAPYMARAHWVALTDKTGVSISELRSLVDRSHQLYFEKLSQKAQRQLLES